MTEPDPRKLANRRREAMEQYRSRARVYDLELALFEPLRRAAIERLALHPGQVVIDVGCGTGLSLTGLRDRVGPRGQVIGIEQCPQMIERARRVVQRHGWRNVVLIESPVESARVGASADAALFHFTHDIVRDATAIQVVREHLRDGATVVACGLQWASVWAWPVNAFVLAAALRSVTSLNGLDRPWSVLARHLELLRVESVAAGAVYIATGRVSAAPAAGEPPHPAPHAGRAAPDGGSVLSRQGAGRHGRARVLRRAAGPGAARG